MNPSPIRHLLFMGALLFVILSSGSLQCALHCYDSAARASDSATFVTDCHPLNKEEIRTEHPTSFCHRRPASSQAQADPVLRSLAGLPSLALLNVRVQTPPCRSVEQVGPPLFAWAEAPPFPALVLPPPQRLRQVRSTVLLM